MTKGDATGWRRGAGVYSKNYAKFNSDGIVHPSDPTLVKVAKRDLSAKVDANLGLSGEVSRGTRPKHKQGSWKRV